MATTAAAAATTTAAITTPIANAGSSEASNTVKTVDASLWWHSFTLLLTDLENVPLSSDLPPPLEKKLEENHAWFLETFQLFKPPNQKSKEALDAHQVKIGSHQLTIESQLKDLALKISSVLSLDEVQSYILAKRSMEHNSQANETMQHELLQLVVLHYYVERQCLLKCTRHILMHALYVETRSKEGCVVRELAQKLIADGLENSLLNEFEELLRSNYPEHMDVDLYILWAEETLIEANLILDVLFLAYYESLCTCTGKQWKKLCLLYEGVICDSYNFGKLAISAEAIQSISRAKVQLLLILIETLDLESLLQMIHDNTPFRQGFVAFSLTDIREMDGMITGFNAFERREAGPLILAWAVFLCLVSSLPEKPENSVLMEIDHVAYVRQAIEAASLSYFLEILDSDILKDPESPVAGYRSVVRTLISAFIASYELEDSNLKLILDILCQIYRGEESLCTQFWDRDSFVDGPIRCLLCNLEGEFPLRTLELVRLLSALSEGAWPAECVFNFLDKSVGSSSLFDIRTGSMVDESSLIIENYQSFHVPGVEGLIIPRRTRGHVIKMIDENIAVVRWERTHSGVLVLLLRVAQGLYMDDSKDALVILDLLSRLVTFNTAVCFALMTTGSVMRDQVNSADEYPENYMRIDVVEIICSLVKNLAPNGTGAVVMSMGVDILAKMLKCSPFHVSTLSVKANIFDVALKTNPFDIGSNGLSSGSWLLSGRLAKMLLIDCEQSDCMLTLSVLDFTMQLMETGSENDVAFALIVFSLQYVLVNHEFWKYKVKHARWKVTLKVLAVLKECISLIPYRPKLSEAVRDILFCDSSIHNALFRIVCTTAVGLEKLYVSRLYDQMDIEGLQQAIYFGLDILSSMLSTLPQNSPVLPAFHQAILSPMTRPIPVVTAAISLISCFRNPKIQVGAVRLLSNLCAAAYYSQGNTCFSLEDEQIFYLKNSISSILCEKSLWDEDLTLATFKLLTSAAHYQPAFLVAVMAREDPSGQARNADSNQQSNEADNGLLEANKANLVDAVLLYVKRSNELIKSKPIILLNLLRFLKTLWHGAPLFAIILEKLRKSEGFWRQFSESIMVVTVTEDMPAENLSEANIQRRAWIYQCQSDVLEMMAYETFLQKKLVHAESLAKETSDGADKSTKDDALHGLKDIFSRWCKGKLLGDLIKSFSSCKYDNSTCMRAKVASCLFLVEVMRKLKAGESGSLSISLVEKVSTLLQKFRSLPAFSELLAHYTERGYSKGKDSHDLVINDLFYHLQGELEGRQIDHRPFKELSQYLMDTKFLQAYQHKCLEDVLAHSKDVYLYDSLRLRADMGLEMWDYSEWKASKAVAEMMLGYMQDVNSMILLSSSKLSALKALITMLSVHGDYVKENKGTIGGDIPEEVTISCINHICQCLVATVESLTPSIDVSEDLLDILAAQAELLFLLVRSIRQSISLPDRVLIIRSSGYGLKVLSGFRSSNAGVRTAMKFSLMLILFSVELSSEYSQATEMESVEAFGEASNITLGLLPVLCSCIELSDHCSLSVTAIDLILRAFSTPATWFPIIQKHLRLQYLIHKLQDKNSLETAPVILKFLLTLACVREGADMIVNAGFFASLRVLVASLYDNGPLPVIQNESCFFGASEKGRKPQHIWGLSLAVVTAVVHSLGDSPSNDIVEYVMVYLFLEKAYLIYYYLSAPGFPFDDHEKKRARAMKTHTSLSALKETEDMLMLMCMLAKHRNTWIKAMKEVDSQLRERTIHLLAFISRANQRHGESRGRVAPFLCHPSLKEEFEWYRQPSSVNSKNGWFALSPLGCSLDPKFSSLSSRTTALLVKDQSNQDVGSAPRTHFSDAAAIQIYRITFLLLKFLCLQAEGAAKRAEEVGFIDLAHFPELPMPDILHGLQDQGVAIVTELCEVNKSKQVTPEIQEICLLLLQITTMALYLEFCVIQICGLRPVLGHVEDFSKELRWLLKATDGHAFMKESVKSLKQIVLFIYPELLQAEALF